MSFFRLRFRPVVFLLRAPGLVVALAAGAASLACGGAASSPLDEAPVVGVGAGDASSPGQTGQTGPTGQDAGSLTSPGTSDAGAPGASKDATVPPPVPPVTVDAGKDSALPPPADPGIECGNTTCDPTSDVCCLPTSGSGHNGGGSPTCESAKRCANDNGLALPCSKPADCIAAGSPAGTVCCVTQGAGTQTAVQVACVPQVQCSDPASQTWMCDPSASDCAAGFSCKKSTTTIPPYSICQP